MMLGLLGMGLAHAQVSDAAFASESGTTALSIAAPIEGTVLEAQVQLMPGFSSPTGLRLIPVVPRLAVGHAQRVDDLRWVVHIQGSGMLSGDGLDRGAAIGVGGAIGLEGPRGRMRAGLEARAQSFDFRTFDDRYRQWTAGLDLSTGFDIRFVTILFRVGTTGGRLRSETIRRGERVEPFFQPRFALGVLARPVERMSVGLVVNTAVQEPTPRVLWSPAITLAYSLM